MVGIDRVALMFLSLGAIPQDALWAAWLEGASGIVPLQPLQVNSSSVFPHRMMSSSRGDVVQEVRITLLTAA